MVESSAPLLKERGGRVFKVEKHAWGEVDMEDERIFQNEDMPESYNDNLHKEAIGKLYQFGRELRQGLTEAEKLLWEKLRGRKLNGLKFRRQHPLDKFIVDFYCNERKLVVELDGRVHDEKMNKEYDEARTAMLAGLNIIVLRFENEEVINDMQGVLKKISDVAEMLNREI
ncbi:MAG TPA: endonuclease domain-containing protein [Chitinophagaceae bacterium]|nr:endonuclease domain-containing protein [Chitinophagaceae bacterium]